MFILDTNVISHLRVPTKAHSGVLSWARAQVPRKLFLSAVSVLEIELGILLKERKDPAQGRVLRNWLNTQVLPEFAERILPVDLAVARACAHLHVPQPKAERDALIAATAIVHGMTVVTRNVSDFVGTGCSVLDPWAAKAVRVSADSAKRK